MIRNAKTKTCVICGLEFQTSQNHAKYCTDSCYRRSPVYVLSLRRGYQSLKLRRPDLVVKWREMSKEYSRIKWATDPVYRAYQNAKCRIRKLRKRDPFVTKSIGCKRAVFKIWIEGQFCNGMTWDNYGSVWNIDHIKPISSFNLQDPAQAISAMHYTNLQPLTLKQNRDKSCNEKWPCPVPVPV